VLPVEGEGPDGGEVPTALWLRDDELAAQQLSISRSIRFQPGR
jgi:hypothetical protein